MRHQLDHGSGRFFVIKLCVTIAIALLHNPVVANFSQFLVDIVTLHGQMLQAAFRTLVEILLIDRWHVIVLHDDLDLLIARICKRC